MLSRISNALGCPKSVDQPSSDSAPGDCSWLSQCARDSAIFSVPSPVFQELLLHMHITWCPVTRQFFFDTFSDSKHADRSTPWSVVHSSRQRCKLTEKVLSDHEDKCVALVNELRSLSSSFEDSVSSSMASFTELLLPLCTSDPSNPDILPDDDLLLLFGSPPTLLQMLLSLSPLTLALTDLVMELVACSSPFSQQLLEQLRQPVGLPNMLSSKQHFSDLCSRLVQLFDVISDPSLQATILTILPDLASASSALTEDDHQSIIGHLLGLLRTVPINRTKPISGSPDPILCLLECLTNFLGSFEASERIYDAYFQLLDRCRRSISYFVYLPVVFRCVILRGPRISASELAKFVRRLRHYFEFPSSTFLGSEFSHLIGSLVDVLRVIFRFDQSLMNEWIRAIDTSPVCDLDAGAHDLQTFHEQAVQDMLVLCVAFGTATMDVERCPALYLRTFGPFTEATQINRSQKETALIVKRLINSGRLFPTAFRERLIDEFFTRHGPYLILDEKSNMFPAFLFFMDQLATASGFGELRSSPASRELGLSVITHIFSHPCSSLSQKEDIVYHLVRQGLCGFTEAKVGSVGRPKKSTVANKSSLKALLTLAQTEPQQMARFENVLFTALERLLQNVASLYSSTGASDLFLHNLLERARLCFTILAWLAFYHKEHRTLQEKLLGLLRSRFSDRQLCSKAFSIIGAVAVLEVICRRPSSQFADKSIIPSSTQMEESLVLASQLSHTDLDRSTTMSTTSRSSTSSCLTLRGSGTGLADDPDEVNLPTEDTEDDDEDVCRTVPPPSRLLLQLIGLVEHATMSHPQLYALWLDELALCFARLAQVVVDPTSVVGSPTAKDKSIFKVPPSVQCGRLIKWMGARAMRDFQDTFIADNTPVEGYGTQLNLNDPAMCEIALNIGPAWNAFRTHVKQSHATLPSHLATKSATPLCPSVLSSQLALLAVVEIVQHSGRLDAIDALIGCPIFLPLRIPDLNADHAQSLADEDLKLLLFVINWCIQLVNTFAPELLHNQTERSTRSYNILRTIALARIRQIAVLRRELVKWCMTTPECADNVEMLECTSDVCLPTVLYEPGHLWTSHATQSSFTGQRKACTFASGFHPNSANLKRAINSGRRALKGPSSKCSASTKRKLTKALSKKPRKKSKAKQDATVEDGNDEECSSEENTSQTRLSSDSEAEVEETDALVDKPAKMAAVRKGKHSVLSPVDLTVCFRELDLAAVCLAFSSWPSDTATPTGMDLDDWETLNWMVEDVSTKIDWLTATRSPVPSGWYAFRRLDALNPDVRSHLVLFLVPRLQKTLQVACELITGNRSSDISSSSSDEAEHITQPPQPTTVGFCYDLTSGHGRLVSNTICHLLHTLYVLSDGNPQGMPVFPDLRRDSSVPVLDQFTVNCLHSLGSACSGTEDLQTGLKALADLYHSQKLYKDILTAGGADTASSTKDSVVLDSPLASSLRCAIEWLIKIAPDGLPHATAAFLHCRLVYQLTHLYFKCFTNQDHYSEDFWVPDLVSLTKALLDQEWDTNARWRAYSHRDSLQGLLAMHLRVRSDCGRAVPPDDILSPTYVLDFTRGLILPAARRYLGGGDTSEEDTVALTGYKSLNRQSVDVYCKEIMNTILWFTKQFCQPPPSLGHRNDCQLLAGWNECVVILGLLVDLLRAPSRSQRRQSEQQQQQPNGPDGGRFMLTLLPSIMRTGRTFLQYLLKGAMPMLNSLFRQRGVEVITFLRNTQTVTRFLQRICTHAKAYRNSQLANQIPATRRCLETFVFQVKIMLSQHQCADAFWLGTLKNRDVHGLVLEDDEEQSEVVSQRDGERADSYSQSIGSHGSVQVAPDSEVDADEEGEEEEAEEPSDDNGSDLIEASDSESQ